MVSFVNLRISLIAPDSKKKLGCNSIYNEVALKATVKAKTFSANFKERPPHSRLTPHAN